MPDDTPASRGALATRIRYRPAGAARLETAATWRLPPDHPDSPPVDRYHAAGHLTDRQHANACALMALQHAAGVEPQQVARMAPLAKGRSCADGYGPEDEFRALVREGGYGCQCALMLIRGELLPITRHSWNRALDYLDTLDGLAARWDGERWGDDE